MIHRSLVAAVSMTALAFAAIPAAQARAEEGMWTFDNFPIARANQTLGTNIDQAWLDEPVTFLGSCAPQDKQVIKFHGRTA